MSFDTATRNRLANFVARCRRLLCGDFNSPGGDMAARLAHYGIQVSGNVAPLESLTHLDEPGLETARLLRDLLAHKRARSPEAKVWKAFDGAVYDLLQEQGFTALNRLCALRMAEERKLITQCVGKGQQSEGFELFEYHTGKTNEGCPVEVRYQQFLYAFFDELALDLGALFARHSPQGLLFPSPQALQTLLGELNHPDLSALWAQDETIGWIYQYWNSKEERGAMREASSAPRNSRELAVRNQFFTPRYVVEFLTDNTLGRIWHEMSGGATSLKEKCRYLVRRPSEVFLQAGEIAPEQGSQEGLSQEELLRQTVYVPHRLLKDPREIRLLDPACGSMHFGLYAFDLFEVIYTEWWDNFATPAQRAELLSDCQLAEGAGAQAISNPTEKRTEFQRHVPRLILENNIHGIDIDPRATQIAGLSLYFRAQRAWLTQKLSASQRPQIRRANIVCAEPMPGEKELLQEFVNRAFSLEERPIFLRMLEDIFDKMQLAGEAGSLLKIEEEIRGSVAEAKKRWKEGPKLEQSLLFSESASGAKQKDLSLDLSGITDEQFWGRVEERIYAALRDYSQQAENGGGCERRLFAEDAARGFAFIDVCRKRYDVAVMNPPYGEASERTAEYLKQRYSEGTNDIFLPFVERAITLGASGELCGALTSRNFMFNQRMADFRKDFLLSKGALNLLADLGNNVLDAAVDVAAFTLSKESNSESSARQAFFFNVVNSDDKAEHLLQFTISLLHGFCKLGIFQRWVSFFLSLPDYRISYSAPDSMVRLFASCEKLAPTHGLVLKGLITGNDERYVRAWQECPVNDKGMGWRRFHKGGEYSPFFSDVGLMINWGIGGAELKVDAERKYGSATRTIKNESYFGKAGLGWGVNNSVGFAVKAVPADCVFADIGPNFQPADAQTLFLWSGFLNSLRAKMVLRLFQSGDRGRFMWIANIIEQMPCPSAVSLEACANPAARATQIFLAESSYDDCSPLFVGVVPELFETLGNLKSAFGSNFQRIQNRARELTEICSKIDEVVEAAFDQSFSDAEGIRALIAEEEHPSAAFLEKFQQRVDSLTASIIGYALGIAFGRWDIRYATGEQTAPELPDPFAPLPVCPPGQLQNAQGLPADPEDVPASYPVKNIPWDGILVDDPNHPLDLERRIREVLDIIWTGKDGGPSAEAIEHEACEILGVKSVRDYFRKPAGFFADHLKRYSKSRRKAPIYWPLSTPSGNYTLWLYYHRLNDGTLYKVVEQVVEPKQAEVQTIYQTLAAKESRTKTEDKELEDAQTLMGELASFREDLFRLAKIWKPNLNDGVVITAAPLWKHFRLPAWQKELRSTWDSLERGEYDWAHLAYSLWPERVTEKCKTDRSLAIAHGLEHLCTIEPPKPKKKRIKAKVEEAE